jgi:hypothetical protein
MKNVSKALLVLGVIMMVGCGVLKKPQVQPSTQTMYSYKDSTVIRDSLRYVDLPIERIVDRVAVYDTLELETSLAKTRAWVDTSKHALVGEMQNKEKAKIKVEYRDRIIYRDSVHTKEVPTPYEVTIEKTKYPPLFWVLLVFAIMVIGKNAPKLIKAANWVAKFDWKKLMFWKKNKKNPEI